MLSGYIAKYIEPVLPKSPRIKRLRKGRAVNLVGRLGVQRVL